MNTVAITSSGLPGFPALPGFPGTAAEGIREELVRKLAERIRTQRLRHQLQRVRPDDRRPPSAGRDEPDAGPRQFALQFLALYLFALYLFALHWPPHLLSASAGRSTLLAPRALLAPRVTGIALG
jgi:hypothetical protein